MQVFSPKNETVLVLRDEVTEKKVGSLYIADRAVELSNQGEVRATGDGSQFEVGQRVVFTKYAGSEIELNSITYLLLKEKEIQGTIKEVASSTDAVIQTADDVNAAAQAALAMLAEQANK